MKKERAKRITITVPAALRARLFEHKERVNISRICAHALEKALKAAMVEMRKEHTTDSGEQQEGPQDMVCVKMTHGV